MALFVCWFVFHYHGNEIKISSTMGDIQGVRTIFRSCSISTADILSGTLNFTMLPQHTWHGNMPLFY
jgi:hypothetical protein